eukprot:COSAG04_NODE_1303_length_7305_cov_10.223980_2_plen_306_part_00
MLWFVLVGQSLQLCCLLVCVGFIVHRDIFSGVLLASVFGHYFLTGLTEEETDGHNDSGEDVSDEESSTPPERCAFFSLRFDDTIPPMAKQLQAALKPMGVEGKIIDIDAGVDIDTEVFSQIEACNTFVVFGSKHYGQDTGNPACTFNEAKFAQTNGKHIILIRMIPYPPAEGSKFDELIARQMFGLNKLELAWEVGKPMPADLPDKVLAGMRKAFPQGWAEINKAVDQSVEIQPASEPAHEKVSDKQTSDSAQRAQRAPVVELKQARNICESARAVCFAVAWQSRLTTCCLQSGARPSTRSSCAC